jgi:hypothetical protein
MEKKDGTLQSTGTGKARIWRTTKKDRSTKEEAVKVAPAEAEA